MVSKSRTLAKKRGSQREHGEKRVSSTVKRGGFQDCGEYAKQLSPKVKKYKRVSAFTMLNSHASPHAEAAIDWCRQVKFQQRGCFLNYSIAKQGIDKIYNKNYLLQILSTKSLLLKI